MFNKKKVIDKPVTYPNGVCVSTESGHFYIKGNKKFKVSNRVLKTWAFRVVPSSDMAISKYKVAGSLGFRAGSVVRNVLDGKLYFIDGILKRHIVSPDILDILGLDYKDILLVSDKEVNIHQDGEPI